jgi:hypothetical protein
MESDLNFLGLRTNPIDVVYDPLNNILMSYFMTCQQIEIIGKEKGYMTQALVSKAFLKSETLKFFGIGLKQARKIIGRLGSP